MHISWLNGLLEPLQELLTRFGVAEESRPIGALIVLYILVTLIVLVFVFIAWRSSRSKPAADAVREPAKGLEEPEVAGETAASPVAAAAETAIPAPASGESLLEQMRSGLGKTRDTLVGRLDSLFHSQSGFSQDLVDELEEILITSDFGMPTTLALIGSLEEQFAKSAATPEEIYSALKAEIASRLKQAASSAPPEICQPTVIMLVGVNGVGKTTTVGKLASHYKAEGKKVLLGAGDTFRAAAADQLEIWSERAGVDIVRHQEGGDPAAVAFDAIKAAVARKVDFLLLDTAGRMHTKANLMDELKKIYRVLGRELTGAPHQTLLVVDATTGQNALAQARLFKEAVDINGIILTKLDGTAKGGIVVAISSDLQIPIRYIGIGEAIDDLRPFDPDLFVQALFGPGDEA